MSTPQKKISIVPQVITSEANDQAAPDARPLFDQDHNVVAFQIGDQILPVSAPDNKFTQLVDTQVYDDAAQAVMELQMRQAQKDFTQRSLARTGIDTEFADSLFPAIRSGVEKFVYDIEFHKTMRQSRADNMELLGSIQDTKKAAIAMTMAGMLESQQQAIANGFESEDYLRDRERYEHRAGFDLELQLKPTKLTHGHELDVLKTKAEADQAMARIEAETRAAERVDTSLEADKDREMDIVKQTMAMGEQLVNAIIELRLVEQENPTERITAAVQMAIAAVDLWAPFATTMSPEEQKKMAPVVQKSVMEAIQQAMKAVRRG